MSLVVNLEYYGENILCVKFEMCIAFNTFQHDFFINVIKYRKNFHYEVPSPLTILILLGPNIHLGILFALVKF